MTADRSLMTRKRRASTSLLITLRERDDLESLLRRECRLKGARR
jgi:hypothetical protein